MYRKLISHNNPDMFDFSYYSDKEILGLMPTLIAEGEEEQDIQKTIMGTHSFEKGTKTYENLCSLLGVTLRRLPLEVDERISKREIMSHEKIQENIRLIIDVLKGEITWESFNNIVKKNDIFDTYRVHLEKKHGVKRGDAYTIGLGYISDINDADYIFVRRRIIDKSQKQTSVIEEVRFTISKDRIGWI